MPDNAAPGFSDLLGLLAGNNPISNITRSMSQFQRGVDELLTTIQNVNGALEQFNRVASRVNSLLDLVEEPLRAFVPQVTRTIRAADEMVERLNAPIDKVAPGLSRLAETLSNPVMTALPKDLNEFLGVLRDLARRLQPLGQMAETAGGLFSRGPFASFLGATPRPEPAAPAALVDVSSVPFDDFDDDELDDDDEDEFDDDDLDNLDDDDPDNLDLDDDDLDDDEAVPAPRRSTTVSRTPAKRGPAPAKRAPAPAKLPAAKLPAAKRTPAPGAAKSVTKRAAPRG